MDFKPLLMALVAVFSAGGTPVPDQMQVPTPTAYVQQAELESQVLAFSTSGEEYAYTEADVEALARIVYWEARGEREQGQIAVANVVLNRVRDTRWPDTIQKVIAQKSQFTPYGNKRYFKVRIPKHFYNVAIRALEGEKAIPDSYCYFSVGKQSRYAKDFIRIGNHYFGKPK